MKQALLILIIAFAFITACSKKENAPTGSVSAKIKALSGNVTVNGNKITSPGKDIVFGDKIVSGDKSFCEIVVNEKNIFKLGEKSSIVFQISDTNNVFLLETGWFSGISRKIFTKGGEYFIKSPTAIASVRGTSFYIKVENKDSTYFCVCNGAIDLKDGQGISAEKVTAAHHVARRFTKGKDGKIAVDKNPGMLYHTDRDIETMSEIIGEKIDWTKPDLH